jgi:AraC-like DNA-binding protein
MDAYSPLRVVALVRDVEWERHIRLALGPAPIIRWIHRNGDLDHTSGLASANVMLWQLEVDAETADAMAPTLRRIRAAMPSSPVILYVRVTPAMARLILTAGRVGVDSVALRGYDDLARVIADVLHATRYGKACEEILSRISPVTDWSTLVLAQCLRHAFESVLTVDRLARQFGVDRKTLHNRLRGAGLPSAATLISWSRLLAAGWLLDDPHQTVAGAARTLNFASASELRGMFSRYVHTRATDLRQRGALRTIAESFREVRSVGGRSSTGSAAPVIAPPVADQALEPSPWKDGRSPLRD